MEKQNRNQTDEQLAQELRKSRGGKLGGKILSLVGVVIAVAGIVLGGSIVVIVIGGVVLALGQMVQGKSKSSASRQAFDAIAPGVIGGVFENVQMDPSPRLLSAEDTNIPLPSHSHCGSSGAIRGTYRGMTAEMCTVRLTEETEIQREETGLWEKNEREVYTGQWMLCELGREFSTWLTIWPREGLDKLLRSGTIKTENEVFNKRFNLTGGDEQEALRILSPSRMERIVQLAESSFGKFAVNLNTDGKLYIAVHSGQGFFDAGKGRETPEQLRQRFTRELKWFTDLVDAFRPMEKGGEKYAHMACRSDPAAGAGRDRSGPEIPWQPPDPADPVHRFLRCAGPGVCRVHRSDGAVCGRSAKQSARSVGGPSQEKTGWQLKLPAGFIRCCYCPGCRQYAASEDFLQLLDADGLDLHQCALGQSAHFHGAAGGIVALGKELGIHGVHGGKIAHILQEHGGLSHMIHGQAGRLHNGLHIGQGLAGLGGDIALHQVAGGGINGDLAGGDDEAAAVDGLGIGADGGRSAGGGDDILFHDLFSFTH